MNAPPNAAIKGLKTLDKVLSFCTYWEGPLCQTPSWPTMAQGRTRAILMVFYKLQHWSWEGSTNKSEGTRASISHRAQQTVPHSRYNSSSSCYLFISFVWHLSFSKLLISSSVIQAIINKLRFERKEGGGRSRGKGKENHIQKAQAIHSTALSQNVALGVMFSPKLGPRGLREDREPEHARLWRPGYSPAPTRCAACPSAIHLRPPETLGSRSWRRGKCRSVG